MVLCMYLDMYVSVCLDKCLYVHVQYVLLSMYLDMYVSVCLHICLYVHGQYVQH